jgi:hypothetical protein
LIFVLSLKHFKLLVFDNKELNNEGSIFSELRLSVSVWYNFEKEFTKFSFKSKFFKLSSFSLSALISSIKFEISSISSDSKSEKSNFSLFSLTKLSEYSFCFLINFKVVIIELVNISYSNSIQLIEVILLVVSSYKLLKVFLLRKSRLQTFIEL